MKGEQLEDNKRKKKRGWSWLTENHSLRKWEGHLERERERERAKEKYRQEEDENNKRGSEMRVKLSQPREKVEQKKELSSVKRASISSIQFFFFLPSFFVFVYNPIKEVFPGSLSWPVSLVSIRVNFFPSFHFKITILIGHFDRWPEICSANLNSNGWKNIYQKNRVSKDWRSKIKIWFCLLWQPVCLFCLFVLFDWFHRLFEIVQYFLQTNVIVCSYGWPLVMNLSPFFSLIKLFDPMEDH